MNDLCQIEREIFFVFAVTLRTTKFFTLPTSADSRIIKNVNQNLVRRNVATSRCLISVTNGQIFNWAC